MSSGELELESIHQAVQTSLENLSGPTYLQALKQLETLQLEKQNLEGKVRGYMTLSDIYHEHREEYRKLKAEYEKLLHKVNSRQSSPVPVEIAGKKTDSKSSTSDPARTLTTNPEQRTDQVTMETQTTVVENRSLRGGPFQAMEASRTPTDHPSWKNETTPTDVRSPSTSQAQWHASLPQGMVRETVPMQESLTEERDKAGGHSDRATVNPSSLSLETEGSYLKVQAGSRAAPNRAPGSSQPSDEDLIVFSGISFPRSTDTENEQSSSSLTEVRDHLSSFSLEGGETTIANQVARYVRNALQRTEKVNSVLIEENKRLLSANKSQETQITSLQKRVQDLEREKYELSRSKEIGSGWVRVEKTSETAAGRAGSPAMVEEGTQQSSHPAEGTTLHDKIRQLQAANKRWVDEWDKLQNHYQAQIDTLQAERDQLTHKITEFQIQDDKRQRECDKMLQTMKKKCQDEEVAKEDALLQLTQAGNQTDSLQAKLLETEEKLNTVMRQKSTLEVELTVVKQQLSGAQGAVVGVVSDVSHKPQHELKTENEVLRQQLLVFQEDFDRERQDRACAQSAKEELKKQNDSYKKRIRHLEQKIASAERQAKNSDDTMMRALQEKERLQQEICDLKNQVRRLQETNARPNAMPQNYNMAPQQGILQAGGPYQQQQQPFQQYQSPGYNNLPQQQYHQQQQPVMQQQPYAGNNFVPSSQQQRQQIPAGPGNQYYNPNQVQSPMEMLPGAWNCNSCTYTNYPGRTVCEMCGYVQPHGQSKPKYTYGNNGGTLRPRGDESQTPPFRQYNNAGGGS